MTAQSNRQKKAFNARLSLARKENLKPPPKLNVVEWADSKRKLSSVSSSEPGQWRTGRVEAARGIMLAVTDPEIHTISIMACTQFLKTELILNTIGFHVDQDPAPMIVVQPTVHMAEAFSKDRIAPMFEESPALKSKLKDKRSRDSGNTILHKQFPGGALTMVGANAPGDLAMRPVRIVLCDEVDKYPLSAGDEGDPIAIITERTAAFWNAKIIHACSPTIEGKSRIAFEYEQSDQRIFEVPCPHCGERQEMEWKNVLWPKGKPHKAKYHCSGCGVEWKEVERLAAISWGTWRATKPFTGHAGFKVNKLASPWETMGKLAKKFVKACKNPELLKTFINTQLAETFKMKGDVPDWKRLYDRREHYKINTIPDKRIMFLTCGVDVQKKYLQLEIVGWGRNKESWSIDYRVLEGDYHDKSPAGPWAKLEKILEETWVHPFGAELKIARTAVDAGAFTQEVRDWCRHYQVSQVMAIKGADSAQSFLGAARDADVVTAGKKKISRGIREFTIGVSIGKEELYGWLNKEKPTDESGDPFPSGYCHFPEYDEEFFRQITGEQLMLTKNKKGFDVYSWEKLRDRNEALDCRNYARAAASSYGLDRFKEDRWKEMEAALYVIKVAVNNANTIEKNGVKFRKGKHLRRNR